MIQRITTIGKNLGRSLILLATVLLLLMAGFIMRGFVPASALQSLGFGAGPLPGWLVPESSPDVMSPTIPSNVVAGIAGEGNPTATAELIQTPTLATFGSSGLITVLTLTPTSDLPAVNRTPASTLAVSTGQEHAVGLTETPEVLPSLAPDPLHAEERIRTDLYNLSRMNEAARIMLAVSSTGLPTDAERAAVQMQLRVVAQRMEILAAQLQSVETLGAEARVAPVQVRDSLVLMLETVNLLEQTLADPEVPPAGLEKGLLVLDQLQDLLGQLQNQTRTATGDVPAPTIAPTLMETALPTMTATPLAELRERYSQMESLLDEIEEHLRLLRAMLHEAP